MTLRVARSACGRYLARMGVVSVYDSCPLMAVYQAVRRYRLWCQWQGEGQR